MAHKLSSSGGLYLPTANHNATKEYISAPSRPQYAGQSLALPWATASPTVVGPTPTTNRPAAATATFENVGTPGLLPIVGRFENLDGHTAEHRPAFFGDLHSNELSGQGAGHQHHPAVVGPADPITPDCY